jgi:anti-sigma factor RsiW
MSEERPSAAENDLQARVDGQLPAGRAAALDGYLAQHPDERQRLADYADQRAALRAVFAAQIDPTVPRRLRVEAILAGRRRRRWQQVSRIAAVIALLVIGGVGGWAARDIASRLASGTPAALAAATERIVTADAIAAHRAFSPEIRHPVEVDATQQAHLVQWLSRRLGRNLVVPDLASAGFQLMGGRLLPAEEGLAAQFMYEKGKDRLTLYVRSDVEGETAFRFHDAEGIAAFYWSDEGLGYALIAKTDRAQLLSLAEIVYHQLTAAGKAGPPPAPGKPS